MKTHDDRTHMVNAIYQMIAEFAQKHGRHMTGIKFKIDSAGNCEGITTTWKHKINGKWK